MSNSQCTNGDFNDHHDVEQAEMPKREEKEQGKIDELRTRLQDLVSPSYNDFFLRKWLKARNFDVNKAEQMFRKSAAYKSQMKVDTLLTDYDPPEAAVVANISVVRKGTFSSFQSLKRKREDPDQKTRHRRIRIFTFSKATKVLHKYLTGGFCGHDKEGSQIRIELFGHLDMKGIMASVRKSDLEKTKLLQCETTVKDWEDQSKKLKRQVDGLTVIFDMEGVTTRMLWRPGLQMYLHLVKVLEDNYPEMLKRLLVINAPRIFPILYKLVRPLISEEMKNKIHVIGGDYKTHLLKFVDAEELPMYLGGNRTDPDGNPRCPSIIGQGGDVPEKYFLDIKELYEHMKTHTIPRGEKFKVPFSVDKTGSILRWEFKTEDYDVGFGVLYTGTDGKATPVVPIGRVNSHVVAEDGSITCEKAGLYQLCFDNSFSWTRSKKIFFEGEVITMNEEDDKFIRSEIHDLVNTGDWQTLAEKFETTHL